MDNIFKSVVIVKNDKGECVAVYDIATLNKDQINAYKKEALENKSKQVELAKEKERKEARKVANDYKICVMLAKHEFDKLVESGVVETNEEFESSYKSFVLGNTSELKNAPTIFNDFLGGLGL